LQRVSKRQEEEFMNRGTRAGTVVVLTIALAAAWAAALAQYSSNELSYEDRARLDALRRSQNEQDAKQAAEMKALRKELMRLAPLPDDRNVLLGS
jgi:hypothetical protein